jgi:hypothetical protein
MAVNPPAGKHTLTVVDENGESVTRSFEIVEGEGITYNQSMIMKQFKMKNGNIQLPSTRMLITALLITRDHA